MLNVLYLHTGGDDFLNLCTFHGMRSLLGAQCVDVPRLDQAYNTLPDKTKFKGNGFTVYGLLPEIPELSARRENWKNEIDDYDLILISDIAKLWRTAFEISSKYPNKKIALLDGSDSTAIFPFESLWRNTKNNFSAFFNDFSRFIFFKREGFENEAMGRINKLISYKITNILKPLPKINSIAFSIPAEKITRIEAGSKSKLLPFQIIDEEIADAIEAVYNPVGSDLRTFDIEAEYFEDLQLSKYGITGKRAGWDCMRHYEMAANGCVLCFKNLKDKPATCAPHGLDNSNSIDYKNYEDLMWKISQVSEKEYDGLLNQTYKWIENNTTVKRAENVLDICRR